MIDPQNPINFNRTVEELEELILFLIVVAGKTAKVQAPALARFLADREGITEDYGTFTPFELIRHRLVRGQLTDYVRKHRLGCYNQITQAFSELVRARLNLRTATLAELNSVYRVGRKSASCFLLWTRPNQRLSALDTHLLKFLRTIMDESVVIPKSTPSSKRMYDLLENTYLEHCDSLGVNPAEYDLVVWKSYVDGGTGL